MELKKCRGTLEKMGYELTVDFYLNDEEYEIEKKKFSHIHVKGCGSFLVDYTEGNIEHYIHDDENPTPNQIQEIVHELVAMAKQKMLKKMF